MFLHWNAKLGRSPIVCPISDSASFDGVPMLESRSLPAGTQPGGFSKNVVQCIFLKGVGEAVFENSRRVLFLSHTYKHLRIARRYFLTAGLPCRFPEIPGGFR